MNNRLSRSELVAKCDHLEAEVEEWKRSLDHAHECHEGELAELGCCRTQLTESNRRLAAMKENWELIIPFLESMTASDNINAEWRGVRDRILSGVTPDREKSPEKDEISGELYREGKTETTGDPKVSVTEDPKKADKS